MLIAKLGVDFGVKLCFSGEWFLVHITRLVYLATNCYLRRMVLMKGLKKMVSGFLAGVVCFLLSTNAAFAWHGKSWKVQDFLTDENIYTIF